MRKIILASLAVICAIILTNEVIAAPNIQLRTQEKKATPVEGRIISNLDIFFQDLLDNENYIKVENPNEKIDITNAEVNTFEGYVRMSYWDEFLPANFFVITTQPDGGNFVGWVRFPIDLKENNPMLLIPYQKLQSAMIAGHPVRVVGEGSWYYYIDTIYSIRVIAD